MRAVVHTRYGDPHRVFQVEDVDVPLPAADEVLVRVRAASMHPDVWHVAVGRPYILRIMGAGFLRPRRRIPGTDLAGVVEAVGAHVARFRPGDEVFGESLRGHPWHNGGAFAQFAAAPESSLAAKPRRISFEEAAAVPTSGHIALKCVRDEGRVAAGQRVLVNGAGGGVGHLALQIAKAFGAHVTAVDAAPKTDLLRSLGADRTMDHATEDFTREGKAYDLIVDVPGNHPPRAIRRALQSKGTYVLVGHDLFGRRGHRWVGSIGRFLRLAMMSPFVSQRMAPMELNEPHDHLAVLARLIEEGKLRSVVDRTFPLDQVPQAIDHLATGTVRGKIVVIM